MKAQKHNQVDLNKVGPAVRRLNPELFGPNSSASAPPARVCAPNRGQIAEKAKGQLKKTRTEAEYEAMLKREFPSAKILFQRYTLRLANDLRYTPDFAVVYDRIDGSLLVEFHEVKGAFLFGGAAKKTTELSLTKPKCAAELFPWHNFYVAQKSKDGQWTRERILPA